MNGMSVTVGKNIGGGIEIMLILDLADGESVILTAPIDEVKEGIDTTFFVGKIKSRNLVRIKK